MSIPPDLDPIQPASLPNTIPSKVRNWGLIIFLSLIAFGLVATIAIGVFAVQQASRLQSLTRRPAPNIETLTTHLLVLQAVSVLADATLYPPEEPDPDYDDYLADLRNELAKGDFLAFLTNRQFESLKEESDQESDQESDAIWEEYEYNEDAAVIAWYLGLTDVIPSIHRIGNVPEHIGDLTEVKPAELWPRVNLRTKPEVELYARRFEAWYEVLSSESYFRDGHYSVRDRNDDWEYVNEKLAEFNDGLPNKSGQFLIQNEAVSALSDEDLSMYLWRAYRRASCFAWIRGYARDHASAEPVGLNPDLNVVIDALLD